MMVCEGSDRQDMKSAHPVSGTPVFHTISHDCPQAGNQSRITTYNKAVQLCSFQLVQYHQRLYISLKLERDLKVDHLKGQFDLK